MKKNYILLLLPLTTSFFSYTSTPAQITNNLFSILKKAENSDYIGESISQLDHALQAAHQASLYPLYDEELIIAALFHDIAHLLKDTQDLKGNEFGVFNHGPIGAQYLRELGFSEKICILVREHATAKRYLARNSDYHANLSHASQQTLITQGGIMSEKEANQFEQHQYFKLLIAIRHCDDTAKNPNKEVAGLDYYRNMIENHLLKIPIKIL